MTFNELLRRLRLVVGRDRRLDDLDEEMRLHLELRAQSNRRAGVPDAEAAARRRFGNLLKLREESRDAWGFVQLERFGRDVRYGWRQLIRRPAWTAAVVLTLSIGIGANTAMFTLVDALLFKPGPGADPTRRVWISTRNIRSGRIRRVSFPDYVTYRDGLTKTMTGVLAYTGADFSIGRPDAERVYGVLVSGNYFDVLGLRMAIGRGFTPDEDRVPGERPVVVLSYGLWQRRYGSDPQILDRTVTLNGRPFRVIGVAPAGFDGAELGENAELWVPLAMVAWTMPSSPQMLTETDAQWLRLQGRLRPGATIDEADAEARGLAAGLNPVNTPAEAMRASSLSPVQGGLDPTNRAELAPVLGLLSAVPLLVLLVACANVGNVLLARNTERRRELAMRRAIGATRSHLVRQLLTESLCLSLAAGGAGVAVSFALIAVIEHLGEVPHEVTAVLTPDLRVLVATTALALVTTILCGLVPALAGTRFDLLPVLKDDNLTSTPSAARRRLKNAFLVIQVAMSLVLLVVAGLFLGSLSKALRVDPGFDVGQTATASVDPNLQAYTRERHAAFVAQAVERAAALPDVVSAAVTSVMPLSGRIVAGTVISDDGQAQSWSSLASVSPRYFETMRIPVVRGRAFSASDVASAEPVVVVSETLARALWRKRDALGQRLRIDDANSKPYLVVGIAADDKYGSLTDNASPSAYFDERQVPQSPLAIVVRTTGDPHAVLAPLTAALREIDPDLPIFRVAAVSDALRQTVDKQRAASAFLAVFGALALLLAAVGIYGVTATNVSLRTREVGIRMSLGASRGEVVRAFVAEAVTLGAIGLVAGAAVSLTASQLLESFLFGLAPTDAMTLAGAALVLAGTAAVASYLAARRAAGVDPLVALRHE